MTGAGAPQSAGWVARRLRELLERDGDAVRVRRGRILAAQGAVSAVKVAAGEATALVRGSRARPYRVSVITPVLGGQEWRTLARALGTQPVFGAALLAGAFPPEVERVFGVLGLRLLPERLGDLVLNCSCPDWGDPCKHAAAALYVLAETLAGDPMLLAEWLGRPRGELLAELRRHARAPRAVVDGAAALAEPDPPGVAEPDMPSEPAAFWRAPALPEPPEPGDTGRAAALAGPPPAAGAAEAAGAEEAADLAELLAPLYERLADTGHRGR
ncbi:SWIM zinc finger family protein [Streptomonospora sp. PA3]|uniref:SWIM zinc finger family protein n=1 Tax=Streptomonospora sp. PA3 TaxID=2607326 RepID=UPI0031BB7641